MKRNILLILAALAVWVAWDSFYVVQEGRLAIVTRFGEYKGSRMDSGPYLKVPFADTVNRMEKRILSSDTPPAEFLTLDKKRLVADPVSRWRIKTPIAFFKSVRDESGARARLDDIINSQLRAEIASHEFGEIIGRRRQPLMDQVTQRARERVKAFGIDLIDVQIKRADLPTEVQESVFQRMRAERDRIAKRYRSEGHEEAAKLRAHANKKREIILAKAYEKSQKLKGEGDAESTSIYGKAFSKDPEFYGFLRSLEAYESAIDEDTNVILSTDNDMLKHMGKAR